jgi:hypothetical protein
MHIVTFDQAHRWSHLTGKQKGEKKSWDEGEAALLVLLLRNDEVVPVIMASRVKY